MTQGTNLAWVADVVDDEGLDRTVGGGEFEAKLLLDGGEDGWATGEWRVGRE